MPEVRTLIECRMYSPHILEFEILQLQIRMAPILMSGNTCINLDSDSLAALPKSPYERIDLRLSANLA